MDNPQPETTNTTFVTVFVITENSSTCTTTQNILQSINNNRQPNTQPIRQLPSIPIFIQNNNNLSGSSLTSQVTSSSLKLNFDSSIYKFDKIPRVTLTDCMKAQKQKQQVKEREPEQNQNQSQQTNSTNSSVVPEQSKPQGSKIGGRVDVRINVTCNVCQSVFTSLRKLLDHLKLKVGLEIKENVEPPQPNQKTKPQQVQSQSPPQPLSSELSSSSPPNSSKKHSKRRKSPLRIRNVDVDEEFPVNNDEESNPTPIIINMQQEIHQPQEINEEINAEIPQVEMEIESEMDSQNNNNNNDIDEDSKAENITKNSTKNCNKKSSSSGEKPIKIKIKKVHNPKREKSSIPKVHVCDRCGLEFSNQASFRGHNLTFHEPRTFVCSMENCTAKFATTNKLKNHMQSHLRTFKCPNPDCTESFRDNYKLGLHLKIHQDPLGRPFKCQVESCSSSFSQPQSLTKHMKIFHPPNGVAEKMFKCSWDGCDSSFWTNGNLKKHMRIHLDERPYKCQVEGCQASFRTTTILKTHGAVHMSSFNQLCNFCGKSFKTRAGLRQHESTHGSSTSSKKTLKNSPRPFLCEISNCFKSFTSQTRLSNHQKIRHASRNEEEQVTFYIESDPVVVETQESLLQNLAVEKIIEFL